VQVVAVVVAMAERQQVKVGLAVAVVEVGQKLPDMLIPAQQERQIQAAVAVEVVTQTLLMVYFLGEAVAQGL
jgi:hypothetical protein